MQPNAFLDVPAATRVGGSTAKKEVPAVWVGVLLLVIAAVIRVSLQPHIKPVAAVQPASFTLASAVPGKVRVIVSLKSQAYRLVETPAALGDEMIRSSPPGRVFVGPLKYGFVVKNEPGTQRPLMLHKVQHNQNGVWKTENAYLGYRYSP